MKKLIFVLLFLSLFMTACSRGNINSLPASEPSGPSSEESPVIEETLLYIPNHSLTLEETIEQFFEQQYNAYTGLQYIDISYLLDMNKISNRNSLIWLESLIQRRRLILEHRLCFIETTKHSYSITYDKEAKDMRMEFWGKKGVLDKDEVTVHFTVTGKKGLGYPPFLAVNAQHTMRLKQIDGIWKITFHYYPGSSKFRTKTPLGLLSEEEMLKDLMEEFKVLSPTASSGETNIPSNASPYNGAQAAQYAKTYSESPNPDFYDIDDWMGNCANYTSQCIWFGFVTRNQPNIARREKMTTKWYAGPGGGSPAWESVENFWNYATVLRGPGKQGLHGEVVESIWQLKVGGIIQTRPGRFRNTDEEYSHNLLLVDSSTLLLAQNSPDCFIYYSDLVNVDTRLFNPRYLIE